MSHLFHVACILMKFLEALHSVGAITRLRLFVIACIFIAMNCRWFTYLLCGSVEYVSCYGLQWHCRGCRVSSCVFGLGLEGLCSILGKLSQWLLCESSDVVFERCFKLAQGSE